MEAVVVLFFVVVEGTAVSDGDVVVADDNLAHRLCCRFLLFW